MNIEEKPQLLRSTAEIGGGRGHFPALRQFFLASCITIVCFGCATLPTGDSPDIEMLDLTGQEQQSPKTEREVVATVALFIKDKNVSVADVVRMLIGRDIPMIQVPGQEHIAKGGIINTNPASWYLEIGHLLAGEPKIKQMEVNPRLKPVNEERLGVVIDSVSNMYRRGFENKPVICPAKELFDELTGAPSVVTYSGRSMADRYRSIQYDAGRRSLEVLYFDQECPHLIILREALEK